MWNQPPQYPYPPQPPPRRSRTALWWSLGIAAVVVVVALVIAGALVARSVLSDGGGAVAAPSSATPPQGAGCGSPGASATVPITDRVVAGPLSFPVAAAPGWSRMGYVTYAQSSLAQGLKQSIPGASWQAHAEIGLTNFDSPLATDEAVRRIIPCIADGAGYASYQPRIEDLSQPERITVDGVTAHRVTATVRVSGQAVAGDAVTVVVIESAPQAYFMSDTPIGDAARAAVARQIFDQLKVARDV